MAVENNLKRGAKVRTDFCLPNARRREDEDRRALLIMAKEAKKNVCLPEGKGALKYFCGESSKGLRKGQLLSRFTNR